MFDAFTIAIVIGTFLLAGTVMGVIGLGLPTVSLALLTVAIGLSRDTLVQSMGMLFTASTVALALALQRNSLLIVELGALSAAASPPPSSTAPRTIPSVERSCVEPEAGTKTARVRHECHLSVARL